jgi:triacylglycerol lipase
MACSLGAMVTAVAVGCGGQSPAAQASRSQAGLPSSRTGTTASPAAPGTSSTTSTSPKPPPPTVVNSSCKPPPQHPQPVVLVPGTYGDTSWQLIAPQLAHLGYCVYTFTYGNNETGDIVTSAQELATWVKRLLARTDSRQVDIVGHSQGGMMPRYYIKFLGGAATVDKLIALAPSNHGTLNPAAFGGALAGCLACGQQTSGSAFLNTLNAGDEAPPPVDYTIIETIDDDVVIPYTSAFLSGPASRVTNITLQQDCPTLVVGHVGIVTDPVAVQWVENALARKGPANPGFVPSC